MIDKIISRLGDNQFLDLTPLTLLEKRCRTNLLLSISQMIMMILCLQFVGVLALMSTV